MSFSDFFLQRHETQEIIDKHKNDFTYDNASEYLKKKGGYKAYVKSLGGVFTKYADFKGPVKSMAEFYDVMDYVWGLYQIWGVDYANGCNWTWAENMYKAYDGGKSRFYPNEKPTHRFDMNYGTPGFANGNDLPTVDEMLAGNGYYAVVNCAQGVAQSLKKAGLIPRSMPDPAYYPARYKANGYNYKLIKRAKDLMPGDVLLFTQGGSIPDRESRSTLDNWTPHIAHTSIVSARDSKYIYTFDSGHAYTYYGEPVSRRKIGDVPYPWCDDWIGIRLDCIAKLSGSKFGWYIEDNHWRYYENGEAVKGWKKIQWSGGNSWFWFDAKGNMVTGWQRLKWTKGTDWFYFDKTGAMVTGWKRLKWSGGTSWFYFNSSGAMLTGLHRLDYKGKQNWYMFDANGAMVTGKKTATVKFSSNGDMTGGKL